MTITKLREMPAHSSPVATSARALQATTSTRGPCRPIFLRTTKVRAMRSQMFPFLDLNNAEPNLPAKLRRLANDLELLMHVPMSPSELRNAPLIDDWVVVVTPLGVQLMGTVTGHPRFGDRPAVTSPLWVADPDGRWVRTTSRYYRFGVPGDAIHDVISAVFDAGRYGGSSEDK